MVQHVSLLECWHVTPPYLHMKKYFLLFRYWNFLYGYYFTKTSFFAISVQFILTHKEGKPKPGAVEQAHWVQGRVFSVQEAEIPVLKSKLHLMEAVCFWTLGMIKRGSTLETPKQPIELMWDSPMSAMNMFITID